jgi:NADP-dependent 3-hydroxy acid dehydrogenase YdfG
VALNGHVGIVTGADTGAGRAIAEALAAQGMSLMLLARPPERLHDLAEELAARHGVRCFAATIDDSDPAAVDRILMHVEQHLGPIDAVISLVPGVLVDAALPAMEARGRGHVVHVPPPELGASPPAVTLVELNPDSSASLADQVLAALGAPA